jgi:hypothetical protein
VTDGIGGVLAGVELFNEAGSTDSLTVSIGLGSGFFTGPFAFTTNAAIAGYGSTYIVTSAADIDLTPGETFVIDVLGVQPDKPCCSLAGSPTAYAGGDLFLNLNGSIADYTADYGYSMAFETFIEGSSVPEVPEPGTLALFGCVQAPPVHRPDWLRLHHPRPGRIQPLHHPRTRHLQAGFLISGGEGGIRTHHWR